VTPEQWSSVEIHFSALAEASPEERAQRLAAIEDATVRDEVISLLANAGSGATRTAAVGAIAGLIAETIGTDQTSVAGRRIGSYRLVRRLAQGGQGTVFEAVRDDGAFQQRVAIKIVNWEMDSAVSRERFRQERQILAAIEHPYVARLLDGGQTEDGSPYLVMEFVQGQPLATAVLNWPLRRKLELFLKVCQAVEYAHRNLVVHRDLKPANILVTANGDPKLLDFGIAKLLDPEATRTQTGFAAMTPDYASPEQVRGEPITTASDVYSLGVILYQLLTGRKPYTIQTGTPAEMDRVICIQPPAPPNLGDELDHILLMALRKEAQRRYGSVHEFAQDIERYLEHRPVLARPDTLMYRTSRYIRRHWIGVLAVTIALTGVIGGAGAAFYQARVARRQFNQVRQLANRFLFDFDAKIANIPGTVEAREMVVSTALEYLNRLSSEASGDPGLQWELAEAFGKVALVQGSFNSPSLRRPRDAAVSYDRAFALARPLAARHWLNPEQRGALVYMLCEDEVQHRYVKELDAAKRLGQEAIDQSEGLTGWPRARALGEMALTLGASGDLLGSLQGLERQLPAIREMARLDPSFANRQRVGSVLYNLGVAYLKLTAFDKAEAAEREALVILRKLAEEHPSDVRTRRYVFQTIMRLGDIAGAADRPSLGNARAAGDLYEQAIAVMAPLVADARDSSSRTDVGLVEGKTARTLRYADPKRALAHAARARELLAEAPSGAAYYGEELSNSAEAYVVVGDLNRAEQLLRQSEQVLASLKVTDDESPLLAWTHLELARGHRDPAVTHLRKAIALSEEAYGKDKSPDHALGFVEDLKLGITVIPESAHQFRQRIQQVWEEQDGHFPGHPWIRQRLAETRADVASHP
jgi:tRNA A-37 threonylcarbamoyl transferase component Bud32/tetratricopeptide (TPR) repeat protein